MPRSNYVLLLVEVMADLDEMLKGRLGLPKIHDVTTKEIERAFIAGQITPRGSKEAAF